MGSFLSVGGGGEEAHSVKNSTAVINNISLPFTSEQSSSTSNIPVCMTHGLGSKNPRAKSHLNDDWLNQVLIPGSRKAQCPYVAYTTRGHGESTGWEASADTDIEQFQWKRLGSDMIEIAKFAGLNSFVAAGSSMGSATALYAAIQNPAKVKGLILVRPPTAWKEREDRRKYLLASAGKCKERHPEEKNFLVLEGTAYSDLPPKEQSRVYSAVQCPVLILALKGDEGHPLSTAYALSKLLKQSVLHVAESESAANRQWPAIIANFLREVSSDSRFGSSF